MQTGDDSAQVGVSLKNAIARVKVARGEKPEFGVDFHKGNTTGSLTVKDGKPNIALQWGVKF